MYVKGCGVSSTECTIFHHVSVLPCRCIAFSFGPVGFTCTQGPDLATSTLLAKCSRSTQTSMIFKMFWSVHLHQSKLNSNIAQLSLSNRDDVTVLINRWVILENQNCADSVEIQDKYWNEIDTLGRKGKRKKKWWINKCMQTVINCTIDRFTENPPIPTGIHFSSHHHLRILRGIIQCLRDRANNVCDVNKSQQIWNTWSVHC